MAKVNHWLGLVGEHALTSIILTFSLTFFFLYTIKRNFYMEGNYVNGLWGQKQTYPFQLNNHENILIIIILPRFSGIQANVHRS